MKKIILILLFSLILCGDKPQNGELDHPRGYWNNTTLKWSYRLGLIDLVDLELNIPDSIKVFKDILFKETSEKALKLDIYKKNNITNPTPLIVFIHGGSWKYGQKEDYLIYLLEFAKRGYTTASLSYRLSNIAQFPAAVEDINCGVKWLKQNGTDYGIDTSKVVIVGGSAGGHLAMMIGYTDKYQSCGNVGNVQGIVNIYGPCDLTTDFALSKPVLTEFIGQNYDENPTPFEDASPINYISSDNPPTLTFHGTIDQIVPVSQADTLNNKLKEYQVYHEYHRLKGWPHTMDLAVPVNNYMKFYMDKFFKKVIPFNTTQ